VQAVNVTIEDELSANEILGLLDQLPTGYRTVFNLYVLEGFKHKEIAELLDISINTSKSQLILAKKRLKDLVEKSYIVRSGGFETS
jgi:RNA polymerase sigma-70 factor (ECF subfamily)